MLLSVGYVNSKSMGREAFQEIDQHAFFGTVAKAVLEPATVDHVARITAKAGGLSTDEEHGPVVVQIPRDMGAGDTSGAVPSPLARPSHAPTRR